MVRRQVGALIVIVVVFWVIVPAMVAQYIGAEKSRMGWAWGLFLGWFGVLIVAVLPPSPEHEKVTANRRAAMYRECPHCKEQMRRDATVCPHCRGVSPTEPLAVPAARVRGEHSPEAEALLNAAEQYLREGEYERVISELEEVRFETSRRGDVESLEAAVELATRLEAATGTEVGRRSRSFGEPLLLPNLHPRIQSDARQFIEAAHRQIASFREAEGEADGEGADTELVDVSAPSEAATPPGTPDTVTGLTRPPSALEIARERYARGEISRDEFLQLKSDLAD